MVDLLNVALSNHETSVLSSIVQVGVAAYKDLMEDRHPMLGHQYFNNIRGLLRTKLVQMQCEIESHDPNFPFSFTQRKFSYEHCIPELRTKNVIIHIVRSPSPDILPYEAKYKVALSNNNSPLCRQYIIEPDNTPPVALEPFYGLLVFGGKRELFATIQFPAPGYEGIADHIDIPLTIGKTADTEVFERKKAGLKKEFLARSAEEAIS